MTIATVALLSVFVFCHLAKASIRAYASPELYAETVNQMSFWGMVYKSNLVTMPTKSLGTCQGNDGDPELTEVRASTLESPEQVSVLLCICIDNATISKDNLDAFIISMWLMFIGQMHVPRSSSRYRQQVRTRLRNGSIHLHRLAAYVRKYPCKDIPPRIRPPTPTWGMRPPITPTPYGSRAAYTSPQRPPGPTVATFLSALTEICLSFWRSMSTPGSLMDAAPGLGEWPPLRVAKGSFKNLIVLRATETSVLS